MAGEGTPHHRWADVVAALWVVALCLACLAAATRPATSPVQWEVPDEESQQAMEKIIRELYARAYADRSPAGRRKFARTLLEQADRAGEDRVARYVLLRESARLAGEGGEAAVAMRALSMMGRQFQVDEEALKEAAFRRIVPAAHEPRLAQSAAYQAMDLADAAFMHRQEERMQRLLQLARVAANQSGQVKIVLQVRQRQQEMTLLHRQWMDYQAADTRLQSGRATAADRLLCGEMRCFMLDDWAGGLSLLADSSDAALRALAEREIHVRRDDALACLAVGHAWWDYAASLDRLARQQVMRHAARWYRRARPGVSGVDLRIVDKRLAQTPLSPEEIMALRPGLAAEIYAGERFEHLLVRRIDPQVNFDWGSDRIGPTLPKDDFSIRWRGYLIVPREGQYVLNLRANRGGRLILDGQTVIDADNLSRKRNGASMEVHLTAGPHALCLEYWDSGGTAKTTLQWTAPGMSEAQVIPGDALKHQPSGG